MSFRVFTAYSRRFLTSKLPEVLPYILHRSIARSLRVLWYMQELGCGWVTIQDLRNIGAGQWKVLSYVMPDLIKDDLIDVANLTRKNGNPYSKYKINDSGKKVLEIAARHVAEEYEKAVKRCKAFRESGRSRGY